MTENIPLCRCGKELHINRAYSTRGYTKFCSDVCSKKYRNIDKPYNIIMADKDWLYDQRIVQRKSKDLIAEELGCSTTAVNKWLKSHNIPSVRYNESNSHTKIKLENKDFLYDMHVNQKKTCDEIADVIGSSKATISVWLAKHNIETNEPNSYPRKHVTTSRECQEVIDFIESIYDGPIDINNRSVLGNGQELDIYMSEHNFAIEYNGIYSHIYRPHEKTSAAIKGKEYHVTKTNICEESGIQLVHIFSNSWHQTKDIWKSFISNKLGLIKNKVYARNCVVRDVPIHEKNVFLEENHIQGRDKSLIKLGLYHKDTLVSVMTFSKSRFNKHYDWELVRFASKTNVSVVGGFSKLLKYFRKNYSGTIISYADRLYSNGSVYRTNGFTLLKTNPPGYRYVNLNNSTVLHRQNCTKKELLKQLNKPHLTEAELAEEIGYKKIFDCGTLTFVMS